MGMILVVPDDRHTAALVSLLADEPGYFAVPGRKVDSDYIRGEITDPMATCKIFAVADFIASDSAGDTVFGRITAMPTRNDGEVEISYIVAPTYRGLGLGTAIVKLMLCHLEESGCAVAVVRIREDNVSSMRVAANNGFTEVRRRSEKDGGVVVKMRRNIG